MGQARARANATTSVYCECTCTFLLYLLNKKKMYKKSLSSETPNVHLKSAAERILKLFLIVKRVSGAQDP